MNFKREVTMLLDDVLHLEGRITTFDDETPLLGKLPELDSMAVIAIIVAIGERFQCVVEDDEIDGSVFATFGSLVSFVRAKAGGRVS